MINEKLTDRIRELLADVDKVEEKKMFSGLAFMADEKLCKWLGIKAKNCDGLRDPKSELESVLGKKKLKYQGKHREKILAQLDGTGDTHSPSMRDAVNHLENAPCMTEK